ncbi:flagellar hook-associated protein FlgK [Chitinimonas naiadis]
MGNSIYGIAVSGLKAAQIGLTTTGHNIANANTPGYNRQQIVQSAVTPFPTGGGFQGRGVEVDTITRIYNEFMARQVQTATSQDGYLSNLQSHLSDLDNLLADPSAGFSPSLQSFFTGVQTVANSPQNVPARQALLGLAQSMITKLNTVNDRMATLRDDVNTEIKATVGNINSITSQIANLNDQIALATGAGGGNPPNDLLDQRDQLVTDLNKYVKSTVIKQSDGSYNIFIGNGQNLVVGTHAFTLGAVQAADDPSRLDVAYQQFGTTAVIPSEMITGGSLGGVLEFRKDVLDVAQNSLGRVAIALAQTVNDQHRKGQDLNGNYGGNFFQFPVENTNAQYNLGGVAGTNLTAQLTSAQPFIESDFNISLDSTGTNYTITRLTDGQTASTSLAGGALTSATGFVAFGVRFTLSANIANNTNYGVSFKPAASNIIANAKNTGNADLQVSLSNPSQLTTSDYEFIYDGPDYRVVRKEDGAVFNVNAAAWNNPPVTVDGMQFRINSGTIKPGDRFTVQPTRGFAENMSVMITDTAKIAAAAPISTSSDTASIVASVNNTNTGTGTITGISASIPAQGGAATKKIELVFTGAATYDIRDSATGATLVANQAYTAGSNITYNGWTVQVAGAPAIGDRFVIDPRKNTGNATITAGAVSTVPVDLNLKVPVAIRFNTPATTYDLVDPATGTVLNNPAGAPMSNQPYTSGANITFNGWTAQVTGIPAAGDTFTIGPNTAGKADARNMLSIGQLQTANTMSGGTTNYQGAYSKIVSDVGVRANQANINQKAQASLLQQAQTKMSETSGVNMDEEASNLLIYQQAYLAASRTIQIAQKAFEEVLNIGR